jgi:hypothetical protein
MTDHNISERERQLRELRSIELQQIATRTLLENKAKRDRFNKFPSLGGKRCSEPAAFGAPQPSAAFTKLNLKQPKLKGKGESS